MVNLTIDGRKIQADCEDTILTAAEKEGITIHSLCYLKEINEIGACRVCVVEVEGLPKLLAACNTQVEEGMVVHTNSPSVRSTRKINVELILSQHNARCASCIRGGNCSLQELANDLGITAESYKVSLPEEPWPDDYYLIRDGSKCVKCMRCIQICDKVSSLGVWDIKGTGSRTTVGVSGEVGIQNANCSLCGQCITHCPVGALHERDDVDRLLEALADPEKITLVQIAPAVRAAWGESLGMERGQATVNRLVSALRAIGIDYVFDTDFSADLTIMEEGSELLGRLGQIENYRWPMFTSCCPGWIRFIKTQYPEMVDQLSTAKSPQQMFGTIAKTYYAEQFGVDPQKIVSVSIMPCLAKKSECDLPHMKDSGYQDVDMVLTTREIDRLIRAENINVTDLEESEFDTPLGTSTGAATIFGATGGVMEAALRSAYFLVTGKNPDPDAFEEIRGMQGWREASFAIEGTPLKVAVASGLENARKLIEALRSGEAEYHFVEIMACPGGCAGGGGQPIWDHKECAEVRAETLYGLDRHANLRFSHENPSVVACYENYLGKPNSHRAHELLHTTYPIDDL